MRFTPSAMALAAGLVAHADAQYLVNELSFGYGVRYGRPSEPSAAQWPSPSR